MTERAWTTPKSMSADWGIEPTAIAWPGRTAGLSAAVFTGQAGRKVEVSSSPDPTSHILAIATRRVALSWTICS
jgi:hypothetical protein